MKKLKIILLIAPFLLFSCGTEKLETNAPPTEVSNEIYQQDGILHFPSVEKCMETIHLLTADNEQGLDAFEDQYHFTSLTSVVDDALETLYEIEDPNVYASALEAYDDLLTVTESGLVRSSRHRSRLLPHRQSGRGVLCQRHQIHGDV